MKHRSLSLLFGLLVLMVGALTAFAGSAIVSGTLNSSDPKLSVVLISTPNCTSQGSTQVAYDSYPFTVDTSGTYTFSVTYTASTNGLVSLYVFANSFNPAGSLSTCILGNNSGAPTSGTISSSIALTVGTQYFFVVFDDTFSQPGATYSATISGPGNILGLGGPSAACTVPLPSGSVVYSVPAGAPAFFAPDLGSQTNFALPAGTWYISEFSGDFAKVWIACQASQIWIPANAVAR